MPSSIGSARPAVAPKGMGMHIPHRIRQANRLLWPQRLAWEHDRRRPLKAAVVQITPAGFIPDMHALCPLPDDGPVAIGVHESHVGRLMSSRGAQRSPGWL